MTRHDTTRHDTTRNSVFWANYPGFLFACWLNLGAVKLMYSSHHGEEARRSMIRYLSQNDISAEQSRSLVRAVGRESGDNDNDNDNTNDNTNDNDVIADPSASPEGSPETSTTAQDWAKIVWDVTSQTTPAKTLHERMVMGMIILWTAVLTFIGFYNHYTQSNDNNGNDNNGNDNNGNDNNGNTTTFGQTVVGYVVNANLVFFYGAPLSSIFRVLRTRSSGSLHVPTMVTNTCNASFWTAYALAPQIGDPFIWVPNGLGVILGAMQLTLWVLFPKGKNGNGDDDDDDDNSDNDGDDNSDNDDDDDDDGSKPRATDEEAPSEDTSASDERNDNNIINIINNNSNAISNF